MGQLKSGTQNLNLPLLTAALRNGPMKSLPFEDWRPHAWVCPIRSEQQMSRKVRRSTSGSIISNMAPSLELETSTKQFWLLAKLSGTGLTPNSQPRVHVVPGFETAQFGKNSQKCVLSPSGTKICTIQIRFEFCKDDCFNFAEILQSIDKSEITNQQPLTSNGCMDE